jgi:hypothetical protein
MIEIFPGKYLGLGDALNTLKKVDNDTFKLLKKDMRKQVAPQLSAIRSRIQQAEAQLRAPGATTGKPANVFSNSRLGWSGASVKFSVSSRKYPRTIVSFDTTGSRKQYGYDVMELAGVQGYNSPQGAAFIAMLNSRLGEKGPTRMAYPVIVKQLPQIRKDVQFILDAYMDQITAAMRN